MRSEWKFTIYVLDKEDKPIMKQDVSLWGYTRHEVTRKAQAQALALFKQTDNADWWYARNHE